MTPEFWRQIEELYKAAVDLSDAGRERLFEGADPKLIAKVEAMLAQDSSTLDHPAWMGRSALLDSGTIVPAETRLGPYQIEQRIGVGGMGQVYRALDTRLGRRVAIKLLSRGAASDGEFKRRFLREARAASALNHPNIVVLHDICRHDGVDFLVMEYVIGRTLKDLISPGGLPFDRLAELGSQIALALGAAHAAGIVHRDIKPANILVTPEQVIKVLDFGIAKMPVDLAETNLTRQGEIVGTVAYMSPEQTRGETVDAHSDIFSLGCVLYEAATGCRPFRGESSLAVMDAIATGDPEAPGALREGLPSEFERLVMRCLAKNPAARPDSAVELATQLKALGLPASAPSPIRAGRPSLAVIPLQLRGPAAEQYLSVSLADALVHRLSASGKLAVRPIASVMRYAGKEVEWAGAARELNVDLLVDGVIQIVGTKIRVLIQAHRFGEMQTLASLKIDGDASDLFGLQDRIADAVNDIFLPRRQHTDRTQPPTRHSGAYELYLRAVDRQVHVDKFEMASAIEMLTRATELDPAFADAWGLLAQACAQMGAHLDTDSRWFETGERAIAKALELDPVQCDALCARGVILWSPLRSFQNRAALRALNAALKIQPLRDTARHQRCAVLWHLGFLDAAAEDAEELQNAVFAAMHKSHIACQRGDFDESMEYSALALRLEPNSILTYVLAPVPTLWAGRLDESRKILDKARQMLSNESFIMGMDAILAALDGRMARAETLADEAVRGRSLTHSHHTWHYCAGAYALCGKTDKALAELQRCADLGLPNHRLFEMDPYLRSLHNHPEFQRLMHALRREHESLEEEFGLGTRSGAAIRD
ncbi:MAG TPA: protein kinase [Bryobacteraceae bacterium]|nr:protein kinase [Bryobacteraceae bacterium]